jgi:hypothetical protein
MLPQFIKSLQTAPSSISFSEVIELINSQYNFSATRFTNGLGDNVVVNEAGTNEGSCRIFAFAKLHGLTEEQTLHCFGDYYRKDVLENPANTDHTNIRTFMRDGWSGIVFDTPALVAKVS